MATSLPPLPVPLDPSIQRYTPDGKPTVAQVEYERKLYTFLRALGAAVSLV